MNVFEKGTFNVAILAGLAAWLSALFESKQAKKDVQASGQQDPNVTTTGNTSLPMPTDADVAAAKGMVDPSTIQQGTDANNKPEKTGGNSQSNGVPVRQ